MRASGHLQSGPKFSIECLLISGDFAVGKKFMSLVWNGTEIIPRECERLLEGFFYGSWRASARKFIFITIFHLEQARRGLEKIQGNVIYFSNTRICQKNRWLCTKFRPRIGAFSKWRQCYASAQWDQAPPKLPIFTRGLLTYRTITPSSRQKNKTISQHRGRLSTGWKGNFRSALEWQRVLLIACWRGKMANIYINKNE